MTDRKDDPLLKLTVTDSLSAEVRKLNGELKRMAQERRGSFADMTLSELADQNQSIIDAAAESILSGGKPAREDEPRCWIHSAEGDGVPSEECRACQRVCAQECPCSRSAHRAAELAVIEAARRFKAAAAQHRGLILDSDSWNEAMQAELAAERWLFATIDARDAHDG